MDKESSMSEQKTACEAILKSLKEDLAKKGSRKKKIDHWKPIACTTIGIKKMGTARWEMILEYGYKNKYFEKEEYGQKVILSPVEEKPKTQELFLESDEKIEVEEQTQEEDKSKRDSKGYLPSDYSTGNRLKSSATRPRSIKQYAHEVAYTPRKGDVMWAIYADGRVVKSEVEEVTFGIHITPMNKKDGHWGYVTSNDLFDTKEEAKKEANKRIEAKQKPSTTSNKYWSSDAMAQEEYALFKEYEDNREEFLKYLEQRKIDNTIDLGLDDLLDDI